ncbi:protein phosphatase [Enterococcus thailandicus]|uniref:Stp1/IreP family PP2C-type Ser/Thr phosphatase n=1 Tax=Enterococcus TaxID=1350 RepID=UPI000A32EBDF|nr:MULTISPECIES: Stp1/IreP family PP2C-type Ser/Thr phosphatase [Enterococcus]ASZ08515.1 serine/threonine-protein phosphatase [Enterococcus thailandicus]MDA3965357.1 Stp1/IreP family PP2C-type Ser/Thr phosphatase [Enterococcus thailandicus]OTP22228.1 serine/threonine protein phosphatase [Enterococcus sp. 5B7_DIV0075]GMC04193.1 protein phosphatase [Enterococcus thailandicus]GMC09616.1 protein phosphatase [Enterococcus thailandicus]
MQIEFQSDVGRRRNTNQDYASVFTNQEGIKLAVLADGMGGHRAGDIASQMAVTNLGADWEGQALKDSEKIAQWFIQTIQNENGKIYQRGQEKPEYNGMGTTIVAAALSETRFTIANVGDSRAYLVREDQLKQLTEDHSLVNELVKSGEISQEMAVNHPRKNILTRSVGMPGTVEVDVATYSWQLGDRLLLCSDGLTNMLSEEMIGSIIDGAGSLTDKVKELIDRANEAGGADNITALLIEYKEDCA